jgi:hypothetical protein
MQQKKKIGALVVAGVAAVGFGLGGAFTASNTLPTGQIDGYGESVATGATVTAIKTNVLATDASKVTSVEFTTTTDVTGKTSTMTLKQGSTVVGTPYTCTVTGTASPWTITCATTDNPLLNSYDTTGLTVN